MPARPHLIGTYAAPAVRKGQRVSCLYRECDCTVTSWSDAPLPWPRVQPSGQRGGCGLWVNERLRQAVRTESAAALRYWFGVSASVAWRWRKAFGVGGHATTRGSKRAIRAAAKKGAEAVRAKVWTDAELDAKAATARRIGLRPGPRWTPARGGWTRKELALLGTDHDRKIAKEIRRTLSAVTSKRVSLKIPAFSGWAGGGPPWAEEELALLGSDHDEVVAKKIGRTTGAVSQKRLAKRIPVFQDRRSR